MTDSLVQNPATKRAVSADDEELVALLEQRERIGIDTEFMRERTYFAQLCLVQIATPSKIYCADPLDAGDLTRFWDALMRCPWIVHSGRQDIEVIYQTTARLPASLFDTQIAAALSGYPPQLGYAALVQALTGRELEKGHTRADWARRPLPAAMLDYAAEDVEFLVDAADVLSERLERLGRFEWAVEDSHALLDVSLYDADPAAAVERIKAARNLRGRARRAAVLLAGWRERRALASNRPRRWILKDSVLVDIAQSNPNGERQLSKIDGMPAATVRRRADELLAILAEASAGDDDYVPPARPDERQKRTLKEMQRRAAAVADELGIAQEVIAPRKALVAAMLGERDGRLFTGWRREAIGERLLELLD